MSEYAAFLARKAQHGADGQTEDAMSQRLDRWRDIVWQIKAAPDDHTAAANVQEAILAVLMDIRSRLDVLRCPTVQTIPLRLEKIEKNTRKRRAARRRAR